MNVLIKSSLFLTLAVGASALAQQPQAATPAPDPTQAAAPVHQANPEHQTKELTKKLGLTADQSAKIEPVLADRDQKIQTLMADTTLEPKTQKKQRRAIMMDFNQKLNAILTPAQQQQLATLKDHRKQSETAPNPAL